MPSEVDEIVVDAIGQIVPSMIASELSDCFNLEDGQLIYTVGTGDRYLIETKVFRLGREA